MRKLITKLIIMYHGSPAKLKKATSRADRLHKKTGLRYRVFFLGMRYRVYNRQDIQNLKREGKFKRNINSTNIDSLKFYDTYNPKPKEATCS